MQTANPVQETFEARFDSLEYHLASNRLSYRQVQRGRVKDKRGLGQELDTSRQL